MNQNQNQKRQLEVDGLAELPPSVHHSPRIYCGVMSFAEWVDYRSRQPLCRNRAFSPALVSLSRFARAVRLATVISEALRVAEGLPADAILTINAKTAQQLLRAAEEVRLRIMADQGPGLDEFSYQDSFTN